MKPSWRLTMPNTALRPKPVPLPGGFVVKNGSKIRWRISAGMPLPVSRTMKQT